MTKSAKNTLQKGTIRYIIFKDEGVWYGVGMEFNIVESGATPQEAIFLLFEATRGYLKSAKKIKGGRVGHLLNQKTDSEYEKMWDDLQSRKRAQEPAPSNVFTSGTLNSRSLVHA